METALFSGPESICYLAGYANQADTSFPFKGSPILIVAVRDKEPGVRTCEVDAAVRGHIENQGYQYEHHTGHGVGVAQSESSWIVPYNEDELKEEMVITLEPGIYPGGKRRRPARRFIHCYQGSPGAPDPPR